MDELTQAFIAGFQSANNCAWIIFIGLLPSIIVRLVDWIK